MVVSSYCSLGLMKENVKLSLTAAYGKCFVVIRKLHSFTSKVFAPAEDGPVSVSTTTTPICKQLHAHNKGPELTWLISTLRTKTKADIAVTHAGFSHSLICLHSKQSQTRAAEKAACPHRRAVTHTHANILACFPSLQSHPGQTVCAHVRQ